jgi:hypothetical protein
METIARRLSALAEEKGLDRVFIAELEAAALEGNTTRFIDTVPLILAALAESRERALLED